MFSVTSVQFWRAKHIIDNVGGNEAAATVSVLLLKIRYRQTTPGYDIKSGTHTQTIIQMLPSPLSGKFSWKYHEKNTSIVGSKDICTPSPSKCTHHGQDCFSRQIMFSTMSAPEMTFPRRMAEIWKIPHSPTQTMRFCSLSNTGLSKLARGSPHSPKRKTAMSGRQKWHSA